MSETKAGNIEAIRDWGKRYFYTKNEVNEMFISRDPLSLINSRWRSGSSNVLTENARYIHSGNVDGIYAMIIPNDSSNAVITNPLLASGNRFKLSVRFKFTDISANSWRTLIANIGHINHLPSISYNAYSKLFNCDYSSNGSSWDKSLTLSFPGLTANEWYRIDYEWDGQKIYGTIFDADDNVLVSNEKSVTNNWYYDSSAYYVLGGMNSNSIYYSRNTIIDIANTYWTVNGDIVWGTDLYEHESRI
jgi:hypothetical protein